MSISPEILSESPEVTVARYPRVDGGDGPTSVRITLRFGTDKFGLSAAQNRDLMWFAMTCRDGDRILETYGMADQTGARDYNLNLSKRRVLSVVHALTGYGVPAEMFTPGLTRALGFDLPEWFYGDEAKGRHARDRAVVVYAWAGLDGFIGIGSMTASCWYGRGGHGIPVF